MKRKRIMIIVIELVLLIGVLYGVYAYTNSQIGPTKVFVFNQPMKTGDVITKDKLAVVEIPARAIDKNFLRDKDLILNKVVTTEVSKGQFVMTDFVTSQEDLNPMKLMDLSKMRKVSFPVEMERALAGNIKSGDVVDLVYIATVDNPDTGQQFVYSKIFMKDVVIWSVNTEDGYDYVQKSNVSEDDFSLNAESFKGEEVTSMDNSGDGDLASVTVVVTGPQAEEIIARSYSGDIQIIGRFSGAENVDSTGYNIFDSIDVFAGNKDPESGDFPEIELESLE